MSFWFWNILGVCVVCIIITGILIPQILLIAFRKNLFDAPDPRKIHHGAVPRLGGIAFSPSIFLSIALCIGINLTLGDPHINGFFGDRARMLTAFFCGLQMIYLVGMADDLVGVRYVAKFVVQVVVGLLLICSGVYFEGLDGILGVWQWPLWVAVPFTLLTIVFLINAINLIDGIDGLASGLSSIATVTFGIAFFLQERFVLAMIAFATLGVLIPFFYYNVFGNAQRHQKIFMGDTGSLTIGLILTFLGIELFSLPGSTPRGEAYNCALAFSPLLIPVFDVFRVYTVRVRQGRSPFLPDKNHIHHKLLAAGMPQRHAMITIIACSLALTLLNLLLVWFINVNLVVLIDLLLCVLLNLAINSAIRRYKRAHPQDEK